MRRLVGAPLLLCLALGSLALAGPALGEGSLDPSLYQDLRYRLIGPFRASRTVGAVGIPTQPNVFYIGINNGGVWKTDDYGRTWTPIFDDAPTGSVGDVAVSPSDPNVLYVGSGEGLHRPDLGVGDGIFKSTDGGESWTHVGLADVQQVGRLIVHPNDPDVVFVAGLGHPYGPNEERGVFRTTDGGATWEKVLYIDHNTGAIQVEFDPTNPEILFADMWEHREGPWENARFSGPNSGLYKSTDGGDTWRRLTEGLPGAEQGLGRIGVGIAPSDPRRMYATVQADADAEPGGGIYRSDDAGESWRRISTDYRLWGRGGDFGEIRVHPENPDLVFVGNIASYRSDDAGQTWTSIKGAPGGDDYHRIWINPLRPEIMLFATDQGAAITVNGGRTWSSWYNQPTAQLYHVSTDNQFPYWVYGGQQESGAIAVASRGPGGQITFREFIGVGADEYAYVAPDPLDPNIVYGGRVVRFDKTTGQSQNVAPEALRSGDYRILRTMPLLFHPLDPKTLFFATNVLWKTTTGGRSWEIVSPDLSREQPEVPPSVGDFHTPDLDTMPRRGVIYAVAPSPVELATIWAGTDDGLVHVTRDGGETWTDVTPPELRPWDKVSQIDAGHFDADTAYLAINAIRRSDMRPHIYRTHDGGQTWQRIVDGLEASGGDGSRERTRSGGDEPRERMRSGGGGSPLDLGSGPINVVREDPKQPGLLFAGSERTIYFSIDDGDSWHSLRQNLPPSSMRDLVIHEDDLVVGTHGRSIWILDNIAPLRELAEAASAEGLHLFSPPVATRVRWNMFSDTPLPPEEPTGENPPDGAILDYYLSEAVDEAALEIVDSSGEVIWRRGSSWNPPPIDPDTLPHPTYWMRPLERLGTGAGHHRYVWDLRYPPPRGARRQFSIAAVFERTPSGPHGPFVPPGTYAVRLTAGPTTVERQLTVRLDPRVEISDEALELQTRLSMRCYWAYLGLQTIREQIGWQLAFDQEVDRRTLESLPNDSPQRAEIEALIGDRPPGDPDILYGSIYAVDPAEETIFGVQHKLLFLLNVLQGADARPTDQAIAAVDALEEAANAVMARAVALVDPDLAEDTEP